MVDNPKSERRTDCGREWQSELVVHRAGAGNVGSAPSLVEYYIADATLPRLTRRRILWGAHLDNVKRLVQLSLSYKTEWSALRCACNRRTIQPARIQRHK